MLSFAQAIVMGLFFIVACVLYLIVVHLQRVKGSVEDVQLKLWVLRTEMRELRDEVTRMKALEKKDATTE